MVQSLLRLYYRLSMATGMKEPNSLIHQVPVVVDLLGSLEASTTTTARRVFKKRTYVLSLVVDSFFTEEQVGAEFSNYLVSNLVFIRFPSSNIIQNM